MSAQLTLHDVHKRYRKRGQAEVHAVRGLDLDVRAGELVGLLGPSGCGKSTTLRVIAGLEDISSGDIRIGDRWVVPLRPGDRKVAVAFESYALFPPMTIRDNLAFGLRARRESDVDKRVTRIAERMGITDLLNARPGGLSSGQKQRVSLARALVRDPDVLLLDEPLSHLDAAARDITRRELRHLQQETGYTTVLVTHDQQEAVSMADRIAVMRDGRLQQFGTPDKIFDDPANLFVASFVGEPAMNLVPGVADQGKVVVSREIAVPVPIKVRPGTAVVLGLRPQDCTLRTGSGDIPATVKVFEHLLEFGQAVVEVPGAEQTLLIQTPDDEHYSPGQRVFIDVPAARRYVFDEQGGQRLR